jgi:hypothetical protein
MTEPATTVAVAPFVAAVQPYLTAAATALVGGAITLAATAFRKFTGFQIDAANLSAIQAAAAIEAGKAVAAASDNLATARINVGSTIVVGAADSIACRMPEVLKAAGVTPDELEHLIAGEIGKLQASMTAHSAPMQHGLAS